MNKPRKKNSRSVINGEHPVRAMRVRLSESEKKWIEEFSESAGWSESVTLRKALKLLMSQETSEVSV